MDEEICLYLLCHTFLSLRYSSSRGRVWVPMPFLEMHELLRAMETSGRTEIHCLRERNGLFEAAPRSLAHNSEAELRFTAFEFHACPIWRSTPEH
jgi:hypothetical protein